MKVMNLRKQTSIRIAEILMMLFILPVSLSAQQKKIEKGLKDYYRDYFPIGVAVTPRQLEDSAQRKLILTHFNSVTAENAMKMGPIHPEEKQFNWSGADAIVNFAVENKLRIRGHNLCWHTQTPKWMFVDSSGNQVSKKVLLRRLRDHIHAVVGRYKGKIYAWDVVNEAISDNPQELLRNSLWYQICGEDFIAKAFQYAHEADPKAILFYNDYNTEYPEKRQRIYKLLRTLKDAGVPGQAGEAGVTEFGPELQQRQSAQYNKLFRVFRENKDTLTGVTFWNLSDRYSWLDNFPIRGRKNYPLLFDKDLQPKAAYWNVIKF